MVDPLRENLIAFWMRLSKTCCSRMGSPTKRAAGSDASNRMRICFCDAMIAIRAEIAAIAAGTLDRADNPLKHAPHTMGEAAGADWPHAYPREQAVFPLPFVRAAKYWPPVKRVDNAFGDRNLVCTCPPMEDYAQAAD